MHKDMVGSAGKASLCSGIDFGHGKIRMNVEDDRLSSLPDDLIHKIVSFISIKHAMRTSIFSSRWRFIWTTMPYLNFSNEELLPKFFTNVLCHRNNQTKVYSVNESSDNVQQLSGTFYAYSIITTPTRDLPALTTLHLHGITLTLCDDNTDKCSGFFSKCPNLKNLSISRCRVKKGMNVLNICHPRLSNLTLEHTYWRVEDFNVDAPQLKNLTITHCYGKHLISAPGLNSLVMKGDHPLQVVATKGFPSLEKVDLCIYKPRLEDAHQIVCLLQQLCNVKLLTLNLDILEVISSSMELSSHQPFGFANLKILKFSRIHPIRVYLEVQAQEIKNYVPDTSPSAIFTMFSCEEIRVMKNIMSAQGDVEYLRRMLSIWGHKRKMHEHGEAQLVKKKQWTVESSSQLQCHFGEMMTEIKQRKIEGLAFPTSETRCMISWFEQMISWLQSIEGLLTQLPASKRAVMQMQPTFSSLCEDAAILMNNVLGLNKNPMDEASGFISNGETKVN